MQKAKYIQSLGLTANSTRSILGGNNYDYLFPASKNNTKFFGDLPVTENIVESMGKMIKERLYETEKIAKKLQKSNTKDTLENIWNFVYNHIQYHHVKGVQYLKYPSYLWANRAKGGNCADYTIFITSILINLGYKPIIRIAGYGEGYQHVYPVVIENGNIYIIDCVVDEFNYEYINPLNGITKKDFTMKSLGIPTYALGEIAIEPIGAIEKMEIPIWYVMRNLDKDFPNTTVLYFREAIDTNRKFNTNGDKFQIVGSPGEKLDGIWTLEQTLVCRFGSGGRTAVNSATGQRKLETLSQVVLPIACPYPATTGPAFFLNTLDGGIGGRSITLATNKNNPAFDFHGSSQNKPTSADYEILRSVFPNLLPFQIIRADRYTANPLSRIAVSQTAAQNAALVNQKLNGLGAIGYANDFKMNTYWIGDITGYRKPTEINLTAQQETIILKFFPAWATNGKLDWTKMYRVETVEYGTDALGTFCITEESTKFGIKNVGAVASGAGATLYAAQEAIKQANLFHLGTKWIAASFPWEAVAGNTIGIDQAEHAAYQSNLGKIIKKWSQLGGDYLKFREANWAYNGPDRKSLIDHLKKYKNFQYYRYFDQWAGKPMTGTTLKGIPETNTLGEAVTAAALIAAGTTIGLALLNMYGGKKGQTLSQNLANIPEPCKSTITAGIAGQIPAKIADPQDATKEIDNPKYVDYKNCSITYATQLGVGMLTPEQQQAALENQQNYDLTPPTTGFSPFAWIKENPITSIAIAAVGSYVFIPAVRDLVNGKPQKQALQGIPQGKFKKKIALKDLKPKTIKFK